MTTETLKPFISAPCCADNSSLMLPGTAARCQHSSNLSPIILRTLTLVLSLLLLGFTIWHFQRISHLETEVKQLDKVILSMQKRLGLTNLDDEDDYRKYNRVFIDKKTILDDDDEKLIDKENDEDIDDDDYDNEYDYEDFRKKLAALNYEDENENEDDIIVANADLNEEKDDESEEEIGIPDDGDVFNDFSKFNATRKKKTSVRKSRSISPEYSNEEQVKKDNYKIGRNRSNNAKQSHNQEGKILVLRRPSQGSKADGKIEHGRSTKEQMGPKRSHRRNLDDRRYKNAIVKNAKSTRQIQTTSNNPAAHFHLNRKIPDRYASIKVDSYSGDMYIGHPSWSNEIDVDNYFKVENGILTVHEPGLYYVYAQVCYNNTHDQNGFVIFHGHKPFLQCLNTVPTNIPHKIHTCHTSGLIFLKESETIHLRDFHSDRNVILKDANNRSYFGLIKI
ncbi:protein eiger isoform X2 [Anastrepha ludens]|uniref:protein eiger isoform X2 n=1 Tax=Anastrepha ludens TaxID=28586 RepID=UPI0023AF4AD0|nr:protein eiger isoform X2 [Anastrepha ludens]